MAATDEYTVSLGPCECCGTDCCLVDLLDADGICLVMEPAVNTFNPDSDPYRFRLYFVDMGGGYYTPGNEARVILAGVDTIEGKQTCYYLEYRISVLCNGSDFRVTITPPNVIQTWSNDTCRWVIGWNNSCESQTCNTGDITFDCTAGTWSTGVTISGDFGWRDERSNTDYTASMDWTVYIGAPSAGPACPAFTGADDYTPENLGRENCGGAGSAIGEWAIAVTDGSVTALEALFGDGACECADTDEPDPWESPANPTPPYVTVDCNSAAMHRFIPATMGGGTGDCNCADGAAFQFVWFPLDTDGHGYYGSTLVRRCGHSIHFLITCVLDGGVPTWFLQGFVDGVETGTIAWDLLPGNDAGNPDHFEFHWQLFGDLCTGITYIVAG